jgi:hypothetical protein
MVNMEQVDPAEVVLGLRPEALSESVSLATPLTLGRITGRDEVLPILEELTAAFGVHAAEYIATNDERTVVTFIGGGQGRPVGLLAILIPDGSGAFGAIDLYARPWPFVAYVQEKLAANSELFRTDVDLSVPYVPSGPTDGFLETPPQGPALAENVAFHSPVLTETASGHDLVVTVLKAVVAVSGQPHYRALDDHGQTMVAIYDGKVHGHAWQLAAVFTLDDGRDLADMRIYSRPWPVSALFRGEAYKLLIDTLGPEFWQGQNPLVALGEA